MRLFTTDAGAARIVVILIPGAIATTTTATVDIIITWTDVSTIAILSTVITAYIHSSFKFF